jgi:hypothetical protein
MWCVFKNSFIPCFPTRYADNGFFTAKLMRNISDLSDSLGVMKNKHAGHDEGLVREAEEGRLRVTEQSVGIDGRRPMRYTAPSSPDLTSSSWGSLSVSERRPLPKQRRPAVADRSGSPFNTRDGPPPPPRKSDDRRGLVENGQLERR